MQTHNRRLYRVARSIVRDGAEAEDVLQEAYLHAFQSLADFAARRALQPGSPASCSMRRCSGFAAIRICPLSHIEPPNQSASHVIPFPINGTPVADPERAMAQRQLCQLVERAIDELPQDFRTVLVTRVVEGMSVDETAALLGIRPETVKSRLHRARRTAQGDARRPHRSAFQRCVSLRWSTLRADHQCRREAAQPAFLMGGTLIGVPRIQNIIPS